VYRNSRGIYTNLELFVLFVDNFSRPFTILFPAGRRLFHCDNECDILDCFYHPFPNYVVFGI